MPAPQARFDDDALDIAVCDLRVPVEDEVEREATISLLPFTRAVALGEPEILEADDDEFEDSEESGEWLSDEDVLLEPSDVIPVEAARSAVLEFDLDAGEDDEFEDEFEDAEASSDETFVDVDVVETSLADASAQTLADGVLVADDDEHDESDESESDAAAAPERALVDPIRVPLWSGVNSFVYALTRGLRGMGQSPLVQLLAIGTMAVCMLLLGTATLILQNATRVAQDLGLDKPVTVYMQPDVDAATLAALQARVAELPEVAAVEHVTPEQALARLQDGLGQGDSLASVGGEQQAELLAGIDASNLPDSLEIALVTGVEPGFADALAARIGEMDGVEEVSALGPWVQEVERMLETLRWLAFGIAALVSLACLAIVWSTIRLGVFARRSEIDILRLVGGTSRFVRGPFVVEGVLQGVLGTALAIACLWLGFELVRPFLERGMALMFAAGSLRFFSMIELGVALGFGALLGLIGSRAAVARHA